MLNVRPPTQTVPCPARRRRRNADLKVAGNSSHWSQKFKVELKEKNVREIHQRKEEKTSKAHHEEGKTDFREKHGRRPTSSITGKEECASGRDVRGRRSVSEGQWISERREKIKRQFLKRPKL